MNQRLKDKAKRSNKGKKQRGECRDIETQRETRKEAKDKEDGSHNEVNYEAGALQEQQ